MKITNVELTGAFVVEAEPFLDHRGAFARFFCEKELGDFLGDKHIVNVNFSRTKKKGALRGMHFQYPPTAEIKMVRCICGAVFDVIVDLRKGSPTFLKWFGVELTSANMKMLFIPEGFAHGFQVLHENSEILYLDTEFYSPEHEGTLNACDPTVGIAWPLEVTEISERDRQHRFIDSTFLGVEI